MIYLISVKYLKKALSIYLKYKDKIIYFGQLLSFCDRPTLVHALPKLNPEYIIRQQYYNKSLSYKPLYSRFSKPLKFIFL